MIRHYFPYVCIHIHSIHTHIHWQTKSTYSVSIYIYIWYTKNMSIASPSYSIPHHIIMVSSKNHRLWSPGSSWEVVRWSECPRWRGPRYPPGRRMGKNMGQSVRNVLVGGWPTPLKIWVRQLGWLFPIYGKINVPNHQPVQVLMGKYRGIYRWRFSWEHIGTHV